ncbi:hypothetical protein Barb4_02721 [Bacteroidales bacterium Barb4]|nr:hypothetical protein Barb4_02721 [Bacteroidales bacterium Barb4]
MTPHSATLHVGLKSGVLAGLPCIRPFRNPAVRIRYATVLGVNVGLKSLAPLGHLHSYFFNCKVRYSHQSYISGGSYEERCDYSFGISVTSVIICLKKQ